MPRPVVVSLLWQKNVRVLARLVQQFGYDIAAPENAIPQSLAEAAAAAGGRILPLSLHLTPAATARSLEVAALASSYLPVIAGGYPDLSGFDERQIAARVQTALTDHFGEGVAWVDALDRLRENENVVGLLVNETDLPFAKTAALWAREHQIPSFLLSHGSNIGGTYTITAQMLADYLFVFGERGKEPYLDMGIPDDRIVVTGNPGWDDYDQILASRQKYRDAVFTQLSLKENAPVVLFATTWNAKLTALHDNNIFETTARAFLSACANLRDRGFAFNAIVKDRPSNGTFGQEMINRIAHEVGFTDVSYAQGDTPVFLCAADVLIGYESNVFVEAMLAEVPSIGVWEPSSWLLGPALDKRDGIPLVQSSNPSGLADVMFALLADPKTRLAVLQEQRTRLPFFHAGNDGRAGDRVAVAIAERISARQPTGSKVAVDGERAAQRFVWHELTDPRSVAEKGGTQEYYDHPRHELIALLDHVPRFVLDIGCAGGATALELKKLHPNVVTHGIELSQEAAALAATRMDRVLLENVEEMDFTAFGYAPESIDVLFLPDVLEHLYNPWQLLVKLKPYLAKDAQVLASIPNVRNAWLLTQLITGRWDYVEEGLLDVTHIRFFTLKSVIELFSQTGYSIERIGQNIDGRMPEVNCPPDKKISFDMGGAAFKDMSAQDIWELRTFQFLVDAKPVR